MIRYAMIQFNYNRLAEKCNRFGVNLPVFGVNAKFGRVLIAGVPSGRALPREKRRTHGLLMRTNFSATKPPGQNSTQRESGKSVKINKNSGRTCGSFKNSCQKD